MSQNRSFKRVLFTLLTLSLISVIALKVIDNKVVSSSSAMDINRLPDTQDSKFVAKFSVCKEILSGLGDIISYKK